jgi:hypothetical protein
LFSAILIGLDIPTAVTHHTPFISAAFDTLGSGLARNARVACLGLNFLHRNPNKGGPKQQTVQNLTAKPGNRDQSSFTTVSANSGLMHRSELRLCSITSTAVETTFLGLRLDAEPRVRLFLADRQRMAQVFAKNGGRA